MRSLIFLSLLLAAPAIFAQTSAPATEPIETVENAATENAATENAATENAATENAATENAPAKVAPVEKSEAQNASSQTNDRVAQRRSQRIGSAFGAGIGSLVGTTAFLGTLAVGVLAGLAVPTILFTLPAIGALLAAAITFAGAYIGTGDLSGGQKVIVSSGALLGHYVGGAVGVATAYFAFSALESANALDGAEPLVLFVGLPIGWTIGAAVGSAIGGWGGAFGMQLANDSDLE